MNENLQKFLEYASQNEQVKQRLDGLEKETDKAALAAKAIEIAKEAGFELTAADFEPDSAGGELCEDELAGVAGGKSCYCVMGGGGTGNRKGQGTCACAIAGGGYYTTIAGVNHRCSCGIYGHGDDYWAINVK